MLRSRFSCRRCAVPAIVLLFLFAPVLVAQTTVAPETAPPKPVLTWTPLFLGIDLADYRCSEPEPLAVLVARIDLKQPGLRFMVTPSNGEEEGETNSRCTSTFLKEFGCQLAVNASPFSPVVQKEGEPLDVLGISANAADRYSNPHGNYAALLLSQDNVARCVAEPGKVEAVYNAVGGFGMLLIDGKNVGSDGQRHPRTAAGVSQNGRYLYLVAIDGRQPQWSVGTTTRETAEWMLHVGCYEAVNLDGGGSTAMVIDDGEGKAQVLNRPINLGIPGMERASANHLGVFAQPIDHTNTVPPKETE